MRPRAVGGLVLTSAALLTATLAAPVTASSAAPDEAPTILSRRVIGYSVNNHPIRAFELGDPDAERTVVAIAAMHGNETGGKVILDSLLHGDPIEGVHLWLVPRQNPDGVLRDRRHNAHGVDLNRNFPTKWSRVTGWYYSGPRPSSEPETRALKRFLTNIAPDRVVSFHSPLRGIDASSSKRPRFAARLAEELHLPVREFDCAGVCHGTLTQWFNKNFTGACVTVELGPSPTWRYLTVRAPRGLVRAIGGSF
jgi:protein MpaA